VLTLLALPGWITGQNAPVTFAATVGNAVPGQQVTVPVMVTGFNNIGAVTLSLDYDYSKLQYISGSKNPFLTGTYNIGDNDLGNGMHRLIFGWFGSGNSLPDSSILLTYTFNYTSGTAGLLWYEMGPSCEYADASANVLNDIPTAEYYINGLICEILPVPGTISGAASLCQGQSGVPYSVPPVPGVQSYHWTVPPGAVITGGIGTNSILVDYSSSALPGNVTVSGVGECGNGPASVLPIQVNPLPVASAGNDTAIGYGTSTQLHAAPGGAGFYTYHWAPENLLVNPNVQNPFTIQMTAGAVFSLQVTDPATLCQSQDEMTLSVTGGPLGVNPMAIPATICAGQYSQLYANAGGGSGNYTYSWTCDPPGTPSWSSTLQNPVVEPDTTTVYFLTVNDGFNSVSGLTHLTVYALPSATVEGGGTVCADGSTVPVIFNLTGTAPWSFIYTDGTNSFSVSGVWTSPHVLNTGVAGTYTVLSISNVYCSGTSSGVAVVEVLPLPPAPVITLIDTVLLSDADEGNQWLHNGTEIPGANDPFYIPHASGSYSCIVLQNGCRSDTSNLIDYIYTGLERLSGSEVTIVPNPAKNNFSLLMKNALVGAVKVTIFNTNGIALRTFVIPVSLLQIGYLFDIHDLSAGLYFLGITTREQIILTKLVVL